MGKSKQTQSTNQTTSQVKDPYAPAKPLINDSIGGVQDWLNNPMSSATYDGGMSDFTKQGLGLLGNAAGAKASSSYMQDVLAGKYLNSENPHQAALDQSIISSVMPSVNSSFSANGMGGSTLHQGMLGKALTQGLAAPRYQQYQNERTAQEAASRFLPGVDAQIGQQALAAGQYQDAFDRGQWEDQRLATLRPFLETAGLTNMYGNMGGSSQGTTQGTTTTSTTPSMGSQILGAGMMGLGAMSGMPGLGMFGQGMSNVAQGAPWSYGSSWTPWVQQGS